MDAKVLQGSVTCFTAQYLESQSLESHLNNPELVFEEDTKELAGLLAFFSVLLLQSQPPGLQVRARGCCSSRLSPGLSSPCRMAQHWHKPCCPPAGS